MKVSPGRRTQRKGLLLDIDGTITNSAQEVSAATSRALLGLAKSKHMVALCTGRHYATIKKKILPYFPKSSLHITSGGGQIIDSEGKVVWEDGLSEELVKKVVLDVESLGGFVVFGNGEYVYCSVGVAGELRKHPWKFDLRVLHEAPNFNVPTFSILSPNPDIINYVGSIKELEVSVAGKYAKTQFLDVTGRGVSKAKAMAVWAQMVEIDLKNVTAVGDGKNDLCVMQVVGHPVAMGNAVEELKSAAGQIIGDVDADGLSEFLFLFDKK